MGFLEPYYGFGMAHGTVMQARNGFYRAYVSMGVSIIFGLFFTAAWPMALGLIKEKVWSPFKLIVICLILFGGALSSMSSAPLYAIVVAIGFICIYPLRRYWPLFVFVLFSGIAFIEMFSNRHFYYVMTNFSFDPSNAYYRIGLFNEAFGGGMTGHWLTGYGYVGVGPGSDNTYFHWVHTDLVNIYIGYLVSFGMLGLVPMIVTNVLYYRSLYRAAKLATTESSRWLLWCITAALVGWNVAMMTVSALAQIETLLAILIGVTVNLPLAMVRESIATNRRRIFSHSRNPLPGGRRVMDFKWPINSEGMTHRSV
jgi:O-antigen ligase